MTSWHKRLAAGRYHGPAFRPSCLMLNAPRSVTRTRETVKVSALSTALAATSTLSHLGGRPGRLSTLSARAELRMTVRVQSPLGVGDEPAPLTRLWRPLALSNVLDSADARSAAQPAKCRERAR